MVTLSILFMAVVVLLIYSLWSDSGKHTAKARRGESPDSDAPANVSIPKVAAQGR